MKIMNEIHSWSPFQIEISKSSFEVKMCVICSKFLYFWNDYFTLVNIAFEKFINFYFKSVKDQSNDV